MEQVGLVVSNDVTSDRAEVAAGGVVTGHSQIGSDEARRKREQRERDAAAGVVTFEVRMAASEALMLAAGRELRGSKGVPYTATEYINTLVRRDHELLQQQLGAIAGRVCENCRKPMPRGCNGLWRNEMPCVLAQFERAMEL